MVVVSNFPNAYKEVYTILKFIDDDDLKLIPNSFINLLKNKMNDKHEFEYDPKKSFDEQNVLRETKAIFSYIFLNYWASKKQSDVINAQFKKDIQKQEEEKNKEYIPDNLFKEKQEKMKIVQNEISNTQTAMEKYKESIFTKVVNWLKRWFWGR